MGLWVITFFILVVYFVAVVFETGSCYVASLKLASNLRSSCLSLLSAGITE
jgi:hypothetical protein